MYLESCIPNKTDAGGKPLIHELLINGAMLVAMIHIGSLYYRYRPYGQQTSLRDRWLLGLACGLGGVVLMFYTVHISDSTILDLRMIPIVLAAANGGMLASMAAGAMIAAFRLMFYGISPTAMLAAANVLVCAALCGWIALRRYPRRGAYARMTLVTMLGTTIVFGMVLPSDLVFRTIVIYWGFAASAGALTYVLMENVILNNLLFQQMKRQSTTDFLTGLNNVRRFDLALNELSKVARERNEPLSLLLIDIDYFKSINDTYGHKAGDDVLRELGRVLTGACRSVDVVSRNGGEEFSALLPACPQDQALDVAERIRRTIESHPFPIDGKTLSITVSVGVASYPEVVESPDELLQKSDDGLYMAKRTGRNRVCVAS